LRIPLFVLSELLSHEANCKEPSKDFPYIRMNVIRFTFIVCEWRNLIYESLYFRFSSVCTSSFFVISL
jgi:hypothetical protein